MRKGNRIITVEQAELKTATVEIRHVVVNARKMTLSVFRQIPEEDLIVESDRQFSLAGVPWGLVNYYWGNMSDKLAHVLWQKDRELRRSLVGQMDEVYGEVDEVTAEVVTQSGHKEGSGSWRYLNRPLWIKVNETKIRLKANEKYVYHRSVFKKDPVKLFLPRRVYKVEGMLDIDVGSYDERGERGERNYELIAGQLANVKEHRRIEALTLHESSLTEEAEGRNRYNQLVSQLLSLPQLFIAV